MLKYREEYDAPDVSLIEVALQGCVAVSGSGSDFPWDTSQKKGDDAFFGTF